MVQKKPLPSYFFLGGALFLFLFYLAFWSMVWHLVLLPHARADKHQLRVDSYAPYRVDDTLLFLDKPDTSLTAYAVWQVPKAGFYYIKLTCDDNGKVSIDNRPIITLIGISPNNVGETKQWLSDGPHFLELHLNNILNQGWLRVEVAEPGRAGYEDLKMEQISWLELGNIEVWLNTVSWGKNFCLLGSLGLLLIWLVVFFRRWTILISFSLILTLAAGELFLRIVFWEGGRKTSGAPGNKAFEYLSSNGGDPFTNRGPVFKKPIGSGLTRILIQGDSITWGDGIRDWKDTYPFRLLQLLNRKNIQYDMETRISPGWEIDSHLFILTQTGPRLQPDIIIYEWYINDLEINKENRPENSFEYRLRFWQSLPTHQFLMSHSYLYYFLNYELDTILPPLNRTYTQYLLQDYDEKTPGWFLFRLTFHDWATLAKCYSKKRILMLYPCLPYKGEYPFKPINDRMKRISSPNMLTFPAVWASKGKGEEVLDPSSYLGRALYVTQEKTPVGNIISTPKVYLEKGEHQVIFRLRGSQLDKKPMIDIKIMAGDHLLSEKKPTKKDFKKDGGWYDITLSFIMDKPLNEQVQFQVDYLGQGNLQFDCIQLPVNYGIEVVDLLPYLKNIKTWVSPFDAHPNIKTHQIMAEQLFRSLTSGKPLSVIK
jgi:hypothetical protein